MTEVRISSAAEEEFADALMWYSQRSLRAATEFDNEVDRAIQLISAAANQYPAFDERHRYYLLRRFPFAIIYRIDEPGVVVVAIAHTSRSPGYWLMR
ncbi:MAG: type II toxin-antitoxin system RelE/ParE family toxin [Planctomycetales bacterium]|nr:type II toxin-antitoxin system RelE/ParE family toxin [Planctomycetales bacterium]